MCLAYRRQSTQCLSLDGRARVSSACNTRRGKDTFHLQAHRHSTLVMDPLPFSLRPPKGPHPLISVEGTSEQVSLRRERGERGESSGGVTESGSQSKLERRVYIPMNMDFSVRPGEALDRSGDS